MNSHLFSVGVVGVALAIGACGDSDDDRPAEPPAAAAARDSQDRLEHFLARDGDEPGFRRAGTPFTDSLAGLTGDGQFTPEAERVLRGSGFVRIAVQRLEGPRGPGLSNVQLHETPTGARRWLVYDQRADVIREYLPDDVGRIRRFTVSGVPGARGWRTREFANVSWVQGRCVLLLGNQGNRSAVADLAAGVRAIHRRTRGRCV